MDTKIEVLLSQKSFGKYPTCHISCNDQIQSHTIDCPIWVRFTLDLADNDIVTLSIEHYGKTLKDTDVDGNRDTAIIIEDIRINGISDQKFIWAGIYRPAYPAHYDPKVAELTNIPYLGFNGTWKLDIPAPLFTWIHQIQGLGWIYD